MTRRPSARWVVRAHETASPTMRVRLVVELVGDQPPAAVDLADAHRVGDADVVVEGRSGVRLPERHERLDREPGVGGVDQEHRDALVAGGVRVGAGRQPHVVGVVGEAGVQLLAVDHPLVAVPHGPGAQRRQVGAGLGFGVPDREVDLAGEDPAEEALLLLLGAEAADGGSDGVGRQEGDRAPGGLRLVEEDVLLDRREPLAPVFDRPAHAQPTVPPDPADQLLVLEVLGELGGRDPLLDVVGHQVREVSAQLGLEGLLVVGQVDEHGDGNLNCGGSIPRRRPCTGPAPWEGRAHARR